MGHTPEAFLEAKNIERALETADEKGALPLFGSMGLKRRFDEFRHDEIAKLHSEAMELNAKSNLPDFRRRVSLALKEGRIDQRRAMAMVEISLKFDAGDMETYTGLNRATRILQNEISRGIIDKATGKTLLTAFEERKEKRRKTLVRESKHKSAVEGELRRRRERERTRQPRPGVPTFELRVEELSGEIEAKAWEISNRARADGRPRSAFSCRAEVYREYLVEDGHGYEVLFDAYMKSAQKTLKRVDPRKRSDVEASLAWNKFHNRMERLGQRYGRENMDALIRLVSNAERSYRTDLLGFSLRTKKVWGMTIPGIVIEINKPEGFGGGNIKKILLGIEEMEDGKITQAGSSEKFGVRRRKRKSRRRRSWDEPIEEKPKTIEEMERADIEHSYDLDSAMHDLNALIENKRYY